MNLCIPTLNRYDLLERLVHSVNKDGENGYEHNIYIIDNGGSLDYSRLKAKSPNIEINVTSFGKNIGVSASWNWFIKNINFPLVISNDDIDFREMYTLDLFTHYYYSLPDKEFYYIQNSGINKFSCFMPTKHLIYKVGYFDETFYPAYFEDNDYQYRMKLAGIKEVGLDIKLIHHVSSTIKAYDSSTMQNHHKDFQKNRLYYITKWGGMPEQETYTTPFGR